MSGKRNWIDLTGDNENDAPQRKRVNHLGSSSQPSASQSLNSSFQGSRDAWGANDEENDIIDLSQDVDEGNGWLCVGAIGKMKYPAFIAHDHTNFYHGYQDSWGQILFWLRDYE